MKHPNKFGETYWKFKNVFISPFCFLIFIKEEILAKTFNFSLVFTQIFWLCFSKLTPSNFSFCAVITCEDSPKSVLTLLILVPWRIHISYFVRNYIISVNNVKCFHIKPIWIKFCNKYISSKTIKNIWKLNHMSLIYIIPLLFKDCYQKMLCAASFPNTAAEFWSYSIKRLRHVLLNVTFKNVW